MTETPSFPAPVNNPESAAFYRHAAAGDFMIRRCDACGKAHWYPRTHCPFCLGTTSWTRASGKGTLYSFSTMQKGGGTETIAYVTLDEGPSMMTSIVDCDSATLAIGQAMRLLFVASADPEAPVPCFTPA